MSRVENPLLCSSILQGAKQFEENVIAFGGTGTVKRLIFKGESAEKLISNDIFKKIIVKESYSSTKEKVEAECHTLKELHSIAHIQKCLCVAPNTKESSSSILYPLIDASVSPVWTSLTEITNSYPTLDIEFLTVLSVKLIQTAIEILEHDTVLSDVQVLIQPFAEPNPNYLFIDFTEAKKFHPRPSLSEIDRQAIESYLLEVKAIALPPIFTNFIENNHSLTQTLTTLIHNSKLSSEIQQLVSTIILSF